MGPDHDLQRILKVGLNHVCPSCTGLLELLPFHVVELLDIIMTITLEYV